MGRRVYIGFLIGDPVFTAMVECETKLSRFLQSRAKYQLSMNRCTYSILGA